MLVLITLKLLLNFRTFQNSFEYCRFFRAHFLKKIKQNLQKASKMKVDKN